jgi:cytochrome c553
MPNLCQIAGGQGACAARGFHTGKCNYVIEIEPMKKILLLTAVLMALPAAVACAGDAKGLYEKDCVKCHGSDGKGDTKMGKKLGAKDYTDAKVQAELKDEAGFKAIKDGLKDKEGKVLMKPAEGTSDEDIKALVAYMRTFKK